jgi:hypothetical protein
MALLFAVLGLFGGLGYRVNHLQELSFIPNDQLEFANATISFSATYDPVLDPFYWLTRNGYVNGTFSVVYVPTSDYPGEFGGPVWGLKPEDRYDYYTTQMTSWGFLPNLFVLLFITILVEVGKVRALYVAVFSGVLGFYVDVAVGTLVCFTVGLVLTLFIMFKASKHNLLARFWGSLWK